MENNFPAPASDFRPPIKLECSLTAFLIVDNNCKIQKLKSCKKRIRSFIRWCDVVGVVIKIKLPQSLKFHVNERELIKLFPFLADGDGGVMM